MQTNLFQNNIALCNTLKTNNKKSNLCLKHNIHLYWLNCVPPNIDQVFLVASGFRKCKSDGS